MSTTLPSVLNMVYGSLARSSVYRVTGGSLAASMLSIGQPTATQAMALVKNTSPVSNTPNLPHLSVAGLFDFMNIYVPNGQQLLRELRTAIAMGSLPSDDYAVMELQEMQAMYRKIAGLEESGSTSNIEIST